MFRFYTLLFICFIFGILIVKSYQPELIWKVQGETASTNVFTFSEDGKYIYVQYSYENDTNYRFIKKWNIEEKKSEKEIICNINISKMIASKNGKYLLAADKNIQFVYLIDLETEEIKTFDKITAKSKSSVSSFSFTDNDTKINVYHNSVKQIQIYDVNTLKKVDSLNVSSNAYYVHLSSDGNYAAFNNLDSTFSILNLNTKEQIYELKMPFPTAYIYRVNFNPVNFVINFPSSLNPENIVVYSMQTGKLITKTSSSYENPYSILLNDNKTILTSSISGGQIEKFDITTGKTSKIHININGYLFEVTQQNDRIVSFDSLNNLKMFDLKTNDIYLSLDLTTENLSICNTVLISPDNKYVYTAGRKSTDPFKKGQIIVRDFKTGTLINNIYLSDYQLIKMIMSDDRTIMAAIDSIGTVYVLKDFNTSDIKIKTFKLGKYMDVLTISNDNSKLFAAGEMTGFYYVNLIKDEIKYGFEDPYDILDIDLRIKSLILNKKGTKLLLAGRKNIVYKYDYNAVKDDYELDNNCVLDPVYFEDFDGIINMAFSEDETKLYSISNYGYFHLTNFTNYTEIYKNKIVSESTKFKVKRAAYFNDKNKAIIGGDKGDIYIFDVNTGGQLITVIQEQPFFVKFVSSVSLSDDNKFAAYSFLDGESGIYRLEEDDTNISIDNNIEYTDFSIYPNPAEDYIEISLHNGASPIASGKVQIFDILGIEIITTPYPLLAKDGEMRIDISHLPSGVYFIRIGDKVEKFVQM